MTTLQEAALTALAFIRWNEFGECRTPGFQGPTPTAAEAADALEDALAQQGEPTDDQLVKGVKAMRLFVTKNSVADFKLGYMAALAAAPAQKPVAYITQTEQGPMVWTQEMYDEACTYCDDGEFPVPLYTVAPQPTSGDYALGYAEGFNDACKPAPQAHPEVDGGEFVNGVWRGVAAPQPAQGVRVISVAQLSSMFRDTNTDKNQWGHYHAKGWNDALRQAMDYAALQSAQPVAQPLTLEQILDIAKKLDVTPDMSHVDVLKTFARAIEKAHGINYEK